MASGRLLYRCILNSSYSHLRVLLDQALYDRVKEVALKAGYAKPEEFIVHIIEKELSVLEAAESDEEVTERLRGLGYLE